MLRHCQKFDFSWSSRGPGAAHKAVMVAIVTLLFLERYSPLPFFRPRPFSSPRSFPLRCLSPWAPPLLLAPPLTRPFGHAQCSPCVGLGLMARCLIVLQFLGIPPRKLPLECLKPSVHCQKWRYMVPDKLALAFSKPPFPLSSGLSQILLCTSGVPLGATFTTSLPLTQVGSQALGS